MKYKCRPGIVLSHICGVRLLIPTRAASAFCPYPVQVSFIGAVCWEAIQRGNDPNTMYKAYQILSKKSDAEVHKKIDSLLAQLCEKGFLMAVEDDAT